MKPKIAFLYNVRHHYPDPNDPRTQEEADFDDPEAIELMIRHLKKAGFSVFPVEADVDAYEKLKRLRNKVALAFNYAEGKHGADREAQLPAILEMLQIPYTGPTPLNQAVIFHKVRTKEVLRAHGIPTPSYFSANAKTKTFPAKLKFPLIVKPVQQGSSAGITNLSVVKSEAELRRQVRYISKSFKQDSLIEEFLPGREFSVPLLGNPPKVMPIIEADHSKLPKGYAPIDSLEVKWFFEEEGEEHHLSCPAKATKKLERRIAELCVAAWEALEIRDWCRMDLRCGKDGEPQVIEVNCPAGLIPPEISTTSYFPMSGRAAGISYPQLMRKVIEAAAKRCGVKL